MRDRFGVILRLSFYAPVELEHIIERASEKLLIRIKPSARKILAERSRGTPRIALRLLKRVRDLAQVQNMNEITENVLYDALTILNIDHLGLDDSDRRYLSIIINKHAGGPIGVETLAAALSEDIGTIEEVIEPYLLQTGLIKRTTRGRMVTDEAYTHLKKIPLKK